MLDLKTQLLTEKTESKNLHLQHLEDQVLNRGIEGARQSIDFIVALRDMLSGQVDSALNVTTKWDGAPSIVCGINPENGKFFVGTKSVFAKNAKLNYTEADIDKNHPNEGLNHKLKMALWYLPKLNIKGILQGDMMFTKGEPVKQTIAGHEYITFTPNTITYAVPAHTTLSQRILTSSVGIVFHTEYHGTTMSSLKTSFKVDLGHLNPHTSVWFRDASFVDQSGTVTFTAEELDKLNLIISDIWVSYQSLNGKVLNQIALNTTYRDHVKKFNNTKVRAGAAINNTTTHTNELIRWLDTTLTASIGDAKMAATKQKRVQEKTTILGFFRSHASDVKLIFDLQNALVRAKMMIVQKLGQIQSTQTFLRTPDGFKVTAPEGFVAVDRIGNAVKLVDRLTFSTANFNAAKDWIK